MPWKDRTIVSIREEFVLKALEPRTNLAALCREFGVSRKTGYTWVERYRSGGVLALRDLSRRPARALSGSVPKGSSTWSPSESATRGGGTETHLGARAERGQVDSCRAHGEPHLGARGLVVARRTRPKRLPATGKPDVRADEPNALWTADYKGWWGTGDMKRCEPLTVRDQHSRFVLAVHVSHSAHLAEARQVFERLFELHGLPERILTDNGSLRRALEPLRPDPPVGLVAEARHRAPSLAPGDAGGQRRARTDARRHRDGAGGPARGDHRGPAAGLRPLARRLQQLPPA